MSPITSSSLMSLSQAEEESSKNFYRSFLNETGICSHQP